MKPGLSELSGPQDLEDLLERAQVAADDARTISSLWDLVAQNRSVIQEVALRRADELGASSRLSATARQQPDVIGTALILSPAILDRLENSLSKKKSEMLAAQEITLASYEEPPIFTAE